MFYLVVKKDVLVSFLIETFMNTQEFYKQQLLNLPHLGNLYIHQYKCEIFRIYDSFHVYEIDHPLCSGSYSIHEIDKLLTTISLWT